MRDLFSGAGLFLVPPARVCVGSGGGGVVGGRSLFENCTVDASIFFSLCLQSFLFVGTCGQVVKGTRWMPGHQEPMKDVGGCEKPRGAANRALIRGCPNGGTPHQSCGVTRA